MLGTVGKGWPPGEWLREDDGRGGGPSPFRGLTIGESRPGPNLERTDTAISRQAQAAWGARDMAATACCPPVMVSSLADRL